MTKTNRITNQRRQLLLDFIHQYRHIVGISPTELEMTLAIGYAPQSDGNIGVIKKPLIEEGWLYYPVEGSRRRAIMPCKESTEWYEPIVDSDLRQRRDIIQRLRTIRSMMNWLHSEAERHERAVNGKQ